MDPVTSELRELIGSSWTRMAFETRHGAEVRPTDNPVVQYLRGRGFFTEAEVVAGRLHAAYVSVRGELLEKLWGDAPMFQSPLFRQRAKDLVEDGVGLVRSGSPLDSLLDLQSQGNPARVLGGLPRALARHEAARVLLLEEGEQLLLGAADFANRCLTDAPDPFGWLKQGTMGALVAQRVNVPTGLKVEEALEEATAVYGEVCNRLRGMDGRLVVSERGWPLQHRAVEVLRTARDLARKSPVQELCESLVCGGMVGSRIQRETAFVHAIRTQWARSAIILGEATAVVEAHRRVAAFRLPVAILSGFLLCFALPAAMSLYASHSISQAISEWGSVYPFMDVL